MTRSTPDPYVPGRSTAVSGRLHGNPPSATSERVWLLLAGCFLGAALLVILRCPVPPMQDFCEWVYQSFVARSLLLHQGAAWAPAVWKHWPVPNEFSQTAMAGLMLLLAPVTAARVFLACYLAGGAFALGRASLRCGASSPNLLFFLLLPLLLVNTTFWTGEVNYEIGLLLFLSYAVSSRKLRQRPLVVLIYSLLLFSAHALPFAFFFLFVLADSFPSAGASWRRLPALLPACALALWYVLRDPRLDDATTFSPILHGPVQLLTYRAYVFAKLGVYHNFVYGGLGDFVRERPIYFAGAAINGLVLLCFGVVLALYLVSAIRQRRFNPAVLLVAFCTVVGLIDPATLLHNANTGERLLLPAVALAVLGGGTGLWRRRAYAAIACVALAFLVLTAIRPPVYLPHAADTDQAAINKPGERTHLFFWTRPYMFADGVSFAEEKAQHEAAGTAPRLSFQTGMLLRAKPAVPLVNATPLLGR